MKTQPSPSSFETTGALSGEILLRKLLGLPLEELGFTPALAKALDDAYVPTIKDLVSRTESELLRWRNLGQKRVDEIKTSLSALGFTLGMDPDAVQSHTILDFALPPLEEVRSPANELRPGFDTWLWGIAASANARCRTS